MIFLGKCKARDWVREMTLPHIQNQYGFVCVHEDSAVDVTLIYKSVCCVLQQFRTGSSLQYSVMV